MRFCGFTKFNLLLCLFFAAGLVSKSFSQNIPYSESLVLWLTADSVHLSNENEIDTIFDLSANNHHAFQNDNLKRGTKTFNSLLNNKYTINFDGINDSYIINEIPNFNNASFTFFAICNGNLHSGVSSSIFAINDYTNGLWIQRRLNVQEYSYISNNVGIESSNDFLSNDGFSFKILGAIKEFGTRAAIFENGNIITESTNSLITGSFTNGGVEIGKSPGFQYWNGSIASIIIYDFVLSQEQIDSVVFVLNDYYGNKVELGENIDAQNWDMVTIDAGDGFESYLWSTGQTTQSISAIPDSIYSVTVTNSFGIPSVDSIKINPPINYPFYLSDTTICLGDSIIWDTDLPSDYSHNWNSTLMDTSVIEIAEPGNYFVEIIGDDGIVFYSDTITVFIDSFPAQNSLGELRTVCKYENITLEEAASGISSYLWSTGSTSNTITIIEPGEYSVTVTNNRGCTSIDTATFMVVGESPIVQFQSDTVCFGDTTTFLNLSIFDPNDTVASYLWEFGDGSSSSMIAPRYRYQHPDTLIARLSAITQNGCQNFFEDTVIVKETPHADFFVKHGFEQCLGQEVQFVDSSKAILGITDYEWDFGNGETSTEPDPIYTFLSEGMFDVTFSITDQNQCSAETTKVVSVSESLPSAEVFELMKPINGIYTIEDSLFFEWDISINAINYQFEIAQDSLFTINAETVNLDSTSLWHPLISTGSWYWRVVAFNLCDSGSPSMINKIKKIDLSDSEEMQFWYSADKGLTLNGSNISNWEDRSGHQRHAVQLDMAKMPKLASSSLKKQDVVYFDGVDDMLIMDSVVQIGSVYVVANSDFENNIFPNYNGLINEPIQGNLLVADIQTSNFYNGFFGESIVISRDTTISFAPLKQYKLIYAENITPDEFEGLIIGSNRTMQHSWLGGVAEIIVYDTILSSQERDEVEKYLRYKYTPPVNLGTGKRFKYDICADTIDAGGRFTSYIWNTGDTTSFITVNQSGKYWVDVIDVFGFHSSDTVMVEFPDITQSNNTICLGDSSLFEINLLGDYTYLWSNNFNGTSQYIKEEAEYWLKITDTLGCFLTDTFYLDVDSFEVQASLGSNRPFCIGDSLNLTVGGSNADSYIWSTGETSSSILISEVGDYSVTVTSINGCTARDTVSLSLLGYKPDADYSNSLTCDGDAVSFNDESSINGSSPINKWVWHFSPNDSAMIQNPSFTFDSAAYYSVSLKVHTEAGCSDSKTDIVTVYSYPQSSYFPYQGCSDVEINFSDASSNEIGAILSWQWNFDDPQSGTANTSNLQNPSHIFDQAGAYNVRLISSNEGGCTDTTTTEVTIKESPQVNFANNEPCFGEYAYFADSTITQPWNEIYMRSWDFGDGNTSNEVTPTHLYEEIGTYTVTYSVYSINGCSVAVSDEITVHAIPEADFLQEDFCANQVYQLMNYSSVSGQAGLDYVWKIEDSIFAYIENPYLIMQDTGLMQITLKAISGFGCEDSVLKQINVYSSPIAEFTFSPEFGSAPMDINFTSTSTGASNFIWDFGNGNLVENIENPTFTYSSNGDHSVKLVTFNEFGCSDTISKSFQLMQTDADVAINNLIINDKNGYWVIGCEIVNAGTRRLTELDLFLQGNSNLSIKEHWEGLLEPGNIMLFEFSSEIKIADYFDLDFICAEALIPGNIDDGTPENNEKCKAINEDAFKLKEVFPNPVKDLLYVRFILPYKGNVKIDLFDSHGGLIGEYLNETCEKGLSTKHLNTLNLRNGIYTIRFTFDENIEIRRFVKGGG